MKPRHPSFVRLSVALMTFALPPAAPRADAADPVVNGAVTGTDGPTSYEGHGEVTTAVERGSGAMTGPFYAVKSDGKGLARCWHLEVGHDAADVKDSEAKGVRIKIQGRHECAPHAEEESPNHLPLIHSDPVDLADGEGKTVIAWGGVSHPGMSHRDYYRAAQYVKLEILGKTANIGLEHAEILAVHSGSRPEWARSGSTLGSAHGPVRGAVYDALRRVLRLGLWAVDVVDDAGGGTQGIAPQYAGDPVLAARLHIGQIELVEGPGPDGEIVFGPGELTLMHPEGLLAMRARFERFETRNETGADGVTRTVGRALLVEGSIIDASSPWPALAGEDGGETNDRAFPPFLSQLAWRVIFAHPEARVLPALTVEFANNLVEASSGLTATTPPLEARVYLGGIGATQDDHAHDSPQLFRRGDGNGDGESDISDVIAALSRLFLGSAAPPCSDAADVNDDGTEDISDPIYLLIYKFLGGQPPPPPGSFLCGPDSTLDGLDCAESDCSAGVPPGGEG